MPEGTFDRRPASPPARRLGGGPLARRRLAREKTTRAEEEEAPQQAYAAAGGQRLAACGPGPSGDAWAHAAPLAGGKTSTLEWRGGGASHARPPWESTSAARTPATARASPTVALPCALEGGRGGGDARRVLPGTGPVGCRRMLLLSHCTRCAALRTCAHLTGDMCAAANSRHPSAGPPRHSSLLFARGLQV
eukprot:scaffold105_cov359-Prasinococcus_capsulatus_cf.AAC.1